MRKPYVHIIKMFSKVDNENFKLDLVTKLTNIKNTRKIKLNSKQIYPYIKVLREPFLYLIDFSPQYVYWPINIFT